MKTATALVRSRWTRVDRILLIALLLAYVGDTLAGARRMPRVNRTSSSPSPVQGYSVCSSAYVAGLSRSGRR